jgi:hypothetical protein
LAEAPSVGNAMQRSENGRKNSFLNYESPALTAELQARMRAYARTSNSQRPTSNFQSTTGSALASGSITQTSNLQ